MSENDANQLPDILIQKKKPGRPRKRIDNVSHEINGIAKKPLDEDSIMESLYDNPKIFKKIFSLFKSYSSTEILMRFDKDKYHFITRGHTKKTIQHATIRGSMLNHYYCEEELECCVRCEKLEKIFSSFDRASHRVTFMLKRDDYRSTFHIFVKDDEMYREDHYEIELIQKDIDLGNVDYSDVEYPLKFRMPSKHFKQSIGDISHLSPMFSYRSMKGEPLSITYNLKNNLNCYSKYMDKDKLNLISKIAPDDIFTVNVKIAHVKPFSNACLGEYIWVACDMRKPTSFTTEIDEKRIDKAGCPTEKGYVCQIKVYMEVSDDIV
jgi:hypothetical protein